jgi:hypothetical protein
MHCCWLLLLLASVPAAAAAARYVDISDSIYPDRYPVLVQQEQVVKVRQLHVCAVEL